MSAAGDRLAQLAEQWELGEAAHAALAALLEVLAASGDAPTTVTDCREAADVHIADSLSALRFPELRDARRIVDLGSGAGFPGLVLAAALPDARLVLLESQRRKCAFIERAARAAQLGNISVKACRVEAWDDGRGWAEIVTARALAAQPVVLEYAAPLLAPGGSLLDWRGRTGEDEGARSALAADELGLQLRELVNAEPWPAARDHMIARYEKVRPTPVRFPRREGVARKRPLGGVPGSR